MTEAMPFLQNTILLSYDPRPLGPGVFFLTESFYVVTMCFYKKKIGDLIVHLLAEVPRRLILRM